MTAFVVDIDDECDEDSPLIIGGSRARQADIRCPTCNGSGTIANTSDNELVVLIPMSDRRLHPHRRCFVALSTFVLCLIISAVLTGLLYPGEITLNCGQEEGHLLKPHNISIQNDNSTLCVWLMYPVEIRNPNFISSRVINASLTAEWNLRIVGRNQTKFVYKSVKPRSTNKFNLSLMLEFSDEAILRLCRPPKESSILVHFEMSTFQVLLAKTYINLMDNYIYVECSSNL
ncbi:hypothetical protein GJ496_009821 [Pomphorhynchus laevis]|nr:hypothetical protein GJ496_009821 [Pomphorhynchus laevis]